MDAPDEKRVKRLAVIVGRPNVGKSAIFNRLAGRRLSIVHSESGVTRDRLVQEVCRDGRRFELVDTGGVTPPQSEAANDLIASGTNRQVDRALDDAAVAILVVDIQAGLHPMDFEVAALLRKRAATVVVAANKADHVSHEILAHEIARLGFPVFPVSALHGRGLDDLMDAVVALLPEAGAAPEEPPLRVAIVGRPNVGKSSYVNRLLESDRVIVSDVPGTTRDSIDVPFCIGEGPSARRYVLTDTAGMRRSGKVDSVVERFSLFRAEDSIRHADVVVHVLDAVQGPMRQDKKIAAAIQEHRRGCVVLVNKWDLQPCKPADFSRALMDEMPFMVHCPVVFVSAVTGHNVRRSVDAIDRVAGQVRLQLPTGVLNRTLRNAWDRVPPQASGKRRLKMFYCTQVGMSPVTVRLFVNEPRLVADAYRSYLIKALRKAFGLEGAPVVLRFTSRSSGEE